MAMASAQYASPCMNLREILGALLVFLWPLERYYLHLDEKGLELAAEGIHVWRVGSGHKRRDVCEHVAERGEEDHPVDGAQAECGGA